MIYNPVESGKLDSFMLPGDEEYSRRLTEMVKREMEADKEDSDWRQESMPLLAGAFRVRRPCRVPGCGNQSRVKGGWCHAHAGRAKA